MQNLIISESLLSLLNKLSTEQACCKLLVRALERVTQGKRTRFLNPAPAGNYWTFRETEGLITFCPAGREQLINDNGTWRREGRQAMKPAKFLREVLHPRLAKRIKEDRKSTRLNSSHIPLSRMPSSA
mgnify:CR=1 FL=1